MSLANFSSYAVSSSGSRERKARDFAAIALSGRISVLDAIDSSIFASSPATPSTGQT